eukprot:sb/3468239/
MSLSALPSLGIGTFQLKSQPNLHNVLSSALSGGIRLIDTAECYKNEHLIAESLTTLLPLHILTRGDVTIVSKVAPSSQGREKCRHVVERSAALFGGYVDVMLIHWPGVAKIKHGDCQNSVLRSESWEVLKELQREGKGGDLRANIKFVSVENGRNDIVHAARTIASEVLSGCTPQITQTTVEDYLKVFSHDNPEMILKFGTLHSLAGYPPWPVHLTEIISLPTCHLISPTDFLDSIRKYNKIEKRVGKFSDGVAAPDREMIYGKYIE